MKIKTFLKIIVVLLVALSACTINNSGREKDDFPLRDLLYTLPTEPLIPYQLEATGADYYNNLINDISKADNYLVSQGKSAMNLGIYCMDVAYLNSYGKNTELTEYFNSIRKLTGYLGIKGINLSMLKQRFESNLPIKDSTARIITEIISGTYNSLKTNNQKETAARIQIGSFVEEMYLSTKLLRTYLTNGQSDIIASLLTRIVLSNEEKLKNLLKLINDFEDEEDFGLMRDGLKEMNVIFEKLISSTNDNKELLLVLAGKVEVLRVKIIE